MLLVKHFKGGEYTVYFQDNQFVYYGVPGTENRWKRLKTHFLSLDERSSTGNRLDVISVLPSYVHGNKDVIIYKDKYQDVTDYDKEPHGINLDLRDFLEIHVDFIDKDYSLML